VTVAWSFSDDSAISYLLPGYSDDVMLSYNGAKGPESNMTLCLIGFARWRHLGCSLMYTIALLFCVIVISNILLLLLQLVVEHF